MKLKVIFFVIFLIQFFNIANAALYKISYVSDDYGILGSFTIDSVDIINHSTWFQTP